MTWRYTYPKPTKVEVDDPVFLIFTKKELVWIIIFAVIASFISFIPIIPNDDPVKIITTLFLFLLILSVWMTAKKIGAKKHYMKIEHKVWTFQRWGWYQRSAFKKPIPIGLIFPFFIAFFTLGYLKPFVFFEYDAKDIPERRLIKAKGGARRVRKEAIHEEDLAYTSAYGFYSLLLLAIIGTIISYYSNIEFGYELAKYSIFYGAWNLVPFGKLDGTKMFFGTFIAWLFLVFLYLISVLAIFLL